MSTLKLENILLLADLFGTPGKDYLIFDPEQLIDDESGSSQIINDLEQLKSSITDIKNAPLTLFNFSNKELLDIYCDEKVGAIVKVNRQNGSAFNPFATYYYLMDDKGMIDSILSPGAKKVSLSIPKSGGISTRIQNSVKEQGIKIGLQKYLANGSFTYYYKNNHPVEQHLKQKDYDGYTIDISKKDNTQIVEVNSWKDSKLVETKLMEPFHSQPINHLTKL